MEDICLEIHEMLFESADEEYKTFHSALMPTVSPEKVIGVRVPELRRMAKKLSKRPDKDEFLASLPHTYYEENNLHGLIIAEAKNFDECIAALDIFLPHIDNWATCDIISPKIFNKNTEKLLKKCKEWISAKDTYTIRFGIEMLMSHFLDEHYLPETPKLVASIRSSEYYVNMMKAWYFATALAKQYDNILPYIENRCLDEWSHNKAIQKAKESYRITDDQKQYLTSLKIKKNV